MIVDVLIEIKVPHKTVKYYNNIGYVCKVNDVIKIDPKHLPKSSEVRINVKCSNCFSINNISNNNYINKQLPKYGFYVCKNCSGIKRKKTILERYGVEYYSKSILFKNKVENTSILKWGVTNYTKTDEYKISSKKTSMEKWGALHYLQNTENYTKLKKILLSRYGVDNAANVKGVNIEKRKSTNLSKYGVEHAMQNSDIFTKMFRNRKKIGELYYDSSYELQFIKYCLEGNIKIENIKGIRYVFENVDRIYYPDFYLPEYNLIIEIKSTWTYNYAVNKNIAKMKSCIENGYDFLFIVDNNFSFFTEKIKNNPINH